MAKKIKKELLSLERKKILTALKIRFEKNMKRHKDLKWTKVEARLEMSLEKL